MSAMGRSSRGPASGRYGDERKVEPVAASRGYRPHYVVRELDEVPARARARFKGPNQRGKSRQLIAVRSPASRTSNGSPARPKASPIMVAQDQARAEHYGAAATALRMAVASDIYA